MCWTFALQQGTTARYTETMAMLKTAALNNRLKKNNLFLYLLHDDSHCLTHYVLLRVVSV